MNAPEPRLPLPEPVPLAKHGLSFAGMVRIALRDLRAGLKGFHVFIACIALGVAAITAVSALGDALRAGFERQGETILGGDIAFSRMHQRAAPPELSWFRQLGTLSETATLRAMARKLDGSDQALIEVKAIDAAYPLKGEIPIEEGQNFRAAVTDSVNGAAVDPILLDRLGLKLGDRVTIGEATVTINATIGDEPDSIADRLTYGPRVFLSLATLEATKLIQPGTLVRWRYAISLPPTSARDAAALVAIRAEAKAVLPDAGFVAADRRDPAPQVSRTLDRLRQFLTFLGLAALLVGGVGVASAVSTFIERRRNVIATMKSLGAPSRTVLSIFLIEVLAIALIGVAIGLAVGLAAPAALIYALGDQLPVKAELTITPASIFAGVAYGVLVSLLFSLWPLGRAEQIRPSVLFRDEVAPERQWPRPAIMALTALVAISLLAFAVLRAEQPRIGFALCGGLAVVLAAFWGLGTLVTYAARRVPRPRTPEIALALGNIGAPGGLTRSVTIALGAGLSLLVAVALANASLRAEIETHIPAMSPNYFVLDIPKADYEGFANLVKSKEPAAAIVEAPMLRGRIVSLKGVPVEQIKPPAEAQWVLNGDRGLTYSETVPEGSRLVEGNWWPADYAGEPLVSFDMDLARNLGLAIGDMITVNVLGRNLEARIANLREVKWESLNLNFVMVFSPNALAAAPHTVLATIALPKTTTLEAEASLAREVGKAYPTSSVIRVKDALEAFKALFSKVMVAVEAAGSITLAAGALVLAGALATAQRRRILEAVVLKVLGATRRRILLAHMIEYTLLAAVSATLAIATGSLAAWLAVSKVMRIPFTFGWGAVGGALFFALALVLAFGAVGTAAVLRARPVPHLRAG